MVSYLRRRSSGVHVAEEFVSLAKGDTTAFVAHLRKSAETQPLETNSRESLCDLSYCVFGLGVLFIFPDVSVQHFG